MKGQQIQSIGVVVLMALAVVGIAFKIFRIRHTANQGFIPPIAKQLVFQLDLIAQEAAYPGKVVHAKKDGVDLISYTCTPSDAAIAVFTVRDRKSHKDLDPFVMAAMDPAGHSYLTTIRSKNGVSIVSITAGFAKRPKVITAAISTAEASTIQTEPIQFTKIAEPVRVLSAPTQTDLAGSGGTAAINVDNHSGTFRLLRPIGTPNDSMVYVPILVGTAFSEKDPFQTSNENPINLSQSGLQDQGLDQYATYLSRGVDAIKVRFDCYRIETSEQTLTYKGAEIIHVNGANMLWYPTRQEVGTILNHTATTYFTQQPHAGRIPKNPVSEGKFFVKLIRKSASKFPFKSSSPHISFRIIEISPRLEDMGLDKLHFLISGPNIGKDLVRTELEIDSLDQTLVAQTPSVGPMNVKVPELKLRVQTRVPHLISSKVVVLPVWHTAGG